VPTAEYRWHYDAYNLRTERGRANTSSRGQRTATVIAYLNDVEAGGETAFFHHKVAVRPRMGRVLYFRNVGSDGLTVRTITYCYAAGLTVRTVTYCYAAGLTVRTVTYCYAAGRTVRTVTYCYAAGLTVRTVTYCYAAGLTVRTVARTHARTHATVPVASAASPNVTVTRDSAACGSSFTHRLR
jgi:hypothetical protein